MRLRPETQCALRILVTLSGAAPPVGVEALAHATKSPVRLVQHALLALAEASLIKSAGEGYQLGFHPRAISVADVIEATGALDESLGCALATPGCSRNHPCAMCWSLIEADLAALRVLRAQTVEELLRMPHSGPVAWSA